MSSTFFLAITVDSQQGHVRSAGWRSGGLREPAVPARYCRHGFRSDENCHFVTVAGAVSAWLAQRWPAARSCDASADRTKYFPRLDVDSARARKRMGFGGLFVAANRAVALKRVPPSPLTRKRSQSVAAVSDSVRSFWGGSGWVCRTPSEDGTKAAFTLSGDRRLAVALIDN